MMCLKCTIQPAVITREGSGGQVGFCLACWQGINKAGSCIGCGTTWDLFINAMWFDIPIEHICGHCRSTVQ